jgi:hypothetical protein
MSLKATSLKSNDSQKKNIKKEVNTILGHLDDELKLAHEQGKHSISLSLPITFAIPYMSNTDAQRAIYYKILVSLIDREFIPTIKLKKDSTIFHITWLSDEEHKEIDLQNTLLAKLTFRDVSRDTLK